LSGTLFQYHRGRSHRRDDHAASSISPGVGPRLIGLKPSEDEGTPVTIICPNGIGRKLYRNGPRGRPARRPERFEIIFPVHAHSVLSPLRSMAKPRQFRDALNGMMRPKRGRKPLKPSKRRNPGAHPAGASVDHEIRQSAQRPAIHLQLMEREIQIKLKLVPDDPFPPPGRRRAAADTRPPRWMRILPIRPRSWRRISGGKGESIASDYIITQFLQARRPAILA